MTAGGSGRFRGLEEWTAAAATWNASEAEALAAVADGPIAGRCGLCGRESRFQPFPESPSPWREGLQCAHCRCNARQRAAGAVLLESLAHPAQAQVYATEQTSAFYLALRKRVARLHGSEFRIGLRRRAHLALWLLRQGAAPWVRTEDVTALRWSDATMDGVVSLDVLEHVPDYRAALREFARVLRPGGALALTVPFYEMQAGNVAIARLDAQGRVEHLAEPEFHGDPVGGGVLCFHHFGWALLDDVREAGFADVVACRVQDMAHALPHPHWVLRAIR